MVYNQARIPLAGSCKSQDTHTQTAVYPTGRFGTPSTNDRALTSETTFDYTVVDPVAKQEYVTTVGNTGPLNEIINDPGKAIKNLEMVCRFLVVQRKLPELPTDGYLHQMLAQ